MVCPLCGSNNTKEQEYNEAETEEVPGIFIKQLLVLCHDCGWGWNCAGTKDNRKKDKTAI